MTDVHAFIGADLDRVKAGRLSANCVHPGGRYFNVVAMSDQSLKKAFRNWAAANITGADEENTFHDARRTITSLCKLESEQAKSMCWEVSKGGPDVAGALSHHTLFRVPLPRAGRHAAALAADAYGA